MNRYVVRALSFAIFIIIWEAMGHIMPSWAFAGATRVFRALIEMMTSGELLQALVDSVHPMLIGFGLSAIVGIPFGLLMGTKRIMEYSFDQYVSALYVTPTAALIPLFILWFGTGFFAKVAFIITFCISEMIITTFHGAKSVTAEVVEVARSFGANRRFIFLKVIMPCTIPFILTALRLGLGRAIKGIVIAELILAITGLGWLLTVYGATFAAAKLFGIIVILMLMGIIASEGIKKLEDIIAPWRKALKMVEVI